MSKPSTFILFIGLVLCGCKKPVMTHPHQVVYRFENVRQLDVIDEWAAIRPVLERNAATDIRERMTRETKFGGKRLRDYEVTFRVNDLPDLVKIQRELDALRDDESTASPMNYELLSTQLTYRSNFVAVGADIVLRGVTIPDGLVNLRIGKRAYQAQADRSGRWSTILSAAPQRPFVYGFAEDPASGARRYFRLNLLSQSEEVITESTFRAVYPTDPKPLPDETSDKDDKEKKPR